MPDGVANSRALAWVLVRYVLSWIILAALIFPTAAFATTRPCTADRLNFCKGVKASVKDIGTCLQGHKDELSEPCKARLRNQPPTAAQAESSRMFAGASSQPLTRADCGKAGMRWNEGANVCAKSNSTAAEAKSGPESAPGTKMTGSTIVINIDKTKQKMSVFIDGVGKYHWPVSTGRPEYSTPSGSYTAISMHEVWYSKEWDNAPMPHSIFFMKDGHAIHGSYEVKTLGRAVSHGCVRISPQNAATLYALVGKNGLKNTQVMLTGVTPGGETKVASRVGPGRTPSGETGASSTPPEQPSPAAAEDSSAETNHATVPSSPPAEEGGNSRPAAESTKATEEPSAAANKAEDSAQPSPEQNGGKSQAAESKKPLPRLTAPTRKPERLTQHVTRAAPNPPLARRSATVRKYRTAKQVVRELPTRRIAQYSPGPMKGSTLSAYDKKVWTTLARHRQKRISGGSAQVTFGVGPSGELVYARLSRSSGNSNVDQMAIATVRKSAPFPQPMAAHGSVQSFSVRIGSR